MKNTYEAQASWDVGQDQYELHTDAGTEMYGSTEAPMVKRSGEASVSHYPNQQTYAYR